MISAHARHVTSAKASDVTSAEATDVTSTEATDVTSAKAAHVASATTAHVASATTTSVSSATATSTAGLGITGKKAAGKHCTCQNHHHSSSHDILLWNGATGLVRRWRFRERHTPTSRWTEDGDAYLLPLLNSRSMNLTECAARL
jgi:hypothetical protein